MTTFVVHCSACSLALSQAPWVGRFSVSRLGLAGGGVAAGLAVAPFVGDDTLEWVFCLNAAAIAGATLVTLVAIDAKRPTPGRRADVSAAAP